MYHDGEALEKAVRDYGMSITRFAQSMGVTRNTPRRWFDMPVLPSDKREAAAKLLKSTPEEVFPRLAKKGEATPHLPSPVTAQAPADPYGQDAIAPSNLLDCQSQLQKWQLLAYENLEKYNKLLERYTEMMLRQPQSVQPVTAELATSST